MDWYGLYVKIKVNKEKIYTKTLRPGYSSNIFFKWISGKHEKNMK
jgi:hypothetical protein